MHALTGLSLGLFGRHVGGRADDPARHGTFPLSHSRDAEVHDFYGAVPVHHDVGWFQVPVNDPLSMGFRRSPAQICRAISSASFKGSDLVRYKRDNRLSPSTNSIEVQAVLLDRLELVDAANILMSNFPREQKFALEVFLNFGIGRDLRFPESLRRRFQ